MNRSIPQKILEKTRKKFKRNRRFRSKLGWYQLGQRRCHCCGVQMTWAGKLTDRSATIEHLVPQSRGGTHNGRNLIVICRLCNRIRGNQNFIEWVVDNNFPKKEWLIAKYVGAVQFYVENDMMDKITISLKQHEKLLKKEA